MHRILPLLIVLIFSLEAVAQDDSWIETNNGIADYSSGESFQVAKLLILDNGKILAFVEAHSNGEEGNGVYELDTLIWTWTRIAPQANGYGFSTVVTDQNRVYEIRDGVIRELSFTTGEWFVIMDIVSVGFGGNGEPSIIDNKVYFRSRLEDNSRFDNIVATHPNEKFQHNEEFVTAVDLTTSEISFLRNPNKPLIISNRGGNFNMSIVLRDGTAYINSTWDYRNNDSYGGFYKWDGTNWSSASSGLNAINITGSGPGPIGPIYTDISKTRIFIKTEQGFFERISDGWIKYLPRTSGRFYITPNYLFAPQGQNVMQVDRALRITHKGDFSGCFSAMRHLITPDEGRMFISEFEIKQDEAGNCTDEITSKIKIGFYRYQPKDGKRGVVQNLHIENGTYVGGEGENFTAETAITNDDKLVVAGIFNSNMGVTPSTLINASDNSKGKLYVMNEWGTSVEQVINLGDAIYDMDMDETTNEVAVIGDFGVVVLHADFTLKWTQQEMVNSDQNGGVRPRVSIAEDGKVVAVVKANEEDVIKLYAADGSTMHINNSLDVQDRKIYDVEINSNAAHNQYYVCGFKQVHRVLQSAYLHAYPLSSGEGPSRLWQTWGFGVGYVDDQGAELTLGNYGADTRLYRIKAVDDGSVYVAGESAGGGPGGFSILAYNGQDISTPIAREGNDQYTNATNANGAVHITYVGIVDPSTGVATKGKYYHGRLRNGKTNSHKTGRGDLEVDEEGNVYIVGTAAARIEGRDNFNVNGKLIAPYSGDQYVLMLSPDLDTRYLWGAFPKANRGGGSHNRIAARRGKVAYFATTTRGEMMTTENAIQAEPYNIVRVENDWDTLRAHDVYLATWQREVWVTANNDEIEYPFISEEECFRVDDQPCVEVPDPEQTLLDFIRPFNILTPNGDGRNDEWQIDNIQVLRKYQLRVFSSSGAIVFSTSNYNENRWDGTNNGKSLPQGVYYYTIYDIDTGQVRTGYITLLR